MAIDPDRIRSLKLQMDLAESGIDDAFFQDSFEQYVRPITEWKKLASELIDLYEAELESREPALPPPVELPVTAIALVQASDAREQDLIAKNIVLTDALVFWRNILDDWLDLGLKLPGAAQLMARLDAAAKAGGHADAYGRFAALQEFAHRFVAKMTQQRLPREQQPFLDLLPFAARALGRAPQEDLHA
jgi:hypothetical protein